MNGESKSNLLLILLDILQKYSDEEHTLSQRRILDILKENYQIKVDRKTVGRNLQNLIDAGYNIEYTEKVRHTKKKENQSEENGDNENVVRSNFYLSRDFSDPELRLLIDSLLCFSHIPNSQCQKLIVKLKGLSSNYFIDEMKHTSVFNDDKGDNKQLFYTIEILSEAIVKKRKVQFNYGEYGIDKKLHCRKQSDGSIRTYLINPYQMAIREGRYYLICNNDKYDTVANYRVDRILNIEITDKKAKPVSELNGINGETLDLKKYLKEHVYMFSDKPMPASFRVSKKRISDVIDVFGTEISIIGSDNENEAIVTAYADKKAFLKFAKSYAPEVVIISPPSLVEDIKKELEESVEVYKKI